ncbi:MAG: hypothetical protein LRS43_03985 [Desulfurococcales archaeon]|nr:hypothetical protein [Desulfurococcales archaeon]
MDARILLILPCNGGVRFGDYGLGSNWRIVYSWLSDYIGSGLVELAAVDSCKPGLVYRGEEYKYRGCDTIPYWDRLYSKDPHRFHMLVEGLRRDIAEAALKYRAIVSYVNVKAYRLALEEASKLAGVPLVNAGPSLLSPLSFRSKSSLRKLRQVVEGLSRQATRSSVFH